MWTQRLIRIVFISFLLVTLSNRALAGEADFAWLSFAPEIGYLHFFEAEAKVDGFPAQTFHARNGLVIKGHMDFGGNGLAVEVAPL